MKKISVLTCAGLLLIVGAVSFTVSWTNALELFNSKTASATDRLGEAKWIEKAAELDSYVKINCAPDNGGGATADNGTADESVSAGVIRGYLAGIGDTEAVYLSPDEYAARNREQSGKIITAGLSVTAEVSGYIRVTSVYPASSAQEAGLLPGDIIKTVNDEDVLALGTAKAISVINNAAVNVKTAVGYQRGSALANAVLTCAEVDSPAVSSVMYNSGGTPAAAASDTTAAASGTTAAASGTTAAASDTTAAASDTTAAASDTTAAASDTTAAASDTTPSAPQTPLADAPAATRRFYALIRIGKFDDTTADKFETAYNNSLKLGAAGLIIDLRSVSDTNYSPLQGILEPLVPAEQLAGATYKDGTARNFLETANDGGTNLPVVVLTDGKTEYAAELLACVLRDFKGAMLVGATTGGKNSVFGVKEFSDKSAALVTIGYASSLKSGNYGGNGIVPTYRTEYASRNGNTYDEGTLFSFANIENDEDVQRGAALLDGMID